MHPTGLKEGANGAKDPKPLWLVEPQRSLFCGRLGHNAPHAHAVPVMLSSIYEPFELSINGKPWLHCWSAAIPSSVPYEFNLDNKPLAVVYLEPTFGKVSTLYGLIDHPELIGDGLVNRQKPALVFRDIYERHNNAREFPQQLDDMLRHARSRTESAIDPRIARVVNDMNGIPVFGEATKIEATVDYYAESIGLSSSRFQHLFSEQVGVPFRRYRTWRRLKTAIEQVIDGNNLTRAAHAAEFCDLAHFSRDFRKLFGAAASVGLSKVRR